MERRDGREELAKAVNRPMGHSMLKEGFKEAAGKVIILIPMG